VIAGDPNVQSVEFVAHALGDLCDELILVGGCAASLLIDAPTAPPPRVTYDVDPLAVVTALRSYHALEEKFAQRGFKRDMSPDAPICRWRIRRDPGGLDAHRGIRIGLFQSLVSACGRFSDADDAAQRQKHPPDLGSGFSCHQV
jgi:hypothetical protein